MAANHMLVPTGPMGRTSVVRLGATNNLADRFADVDEGKIVKLGGDSQFVLAVAGDAIEAAVIKVELATSNGWTIGSISLNGANNDMMYATADGLQATPGTGVVAVGDYVVAGSITAKGTALTQFAKVCKATSQTPGPFAWRIVSLANGAGAVGTKIVIQRV